MSGLMQRLVREIDTRWSSHLLVTTSSRDRNGGVISVHLRPLIERAEEVVVTQVGESFRVETVGARLVVEEIDVDLSHGDPVDYVVGLLARLAAVGIEVRARHALGRIAFGRYPFIPDGGEQFTLGLHPRPGDRVVRTWLPWVPNRGELL